MKQLIKTWYNKIFNKEVQKPEIYNYIDEKGNKCMKFIIPTNNMSVKEAEKQLAELMASYKENVNWTTDSLTGELSINGEKQIPFTKEVWFVNDDKIPEMETIKNK